MTTISARLIAHTQIDPTAFAELGYQVHGYSDVDEGWGMEESHADELAEMAGRNCYLSFKRPNPATAANRDYLAHIIESGHESVLEHSSATFYIHASRSVLTELERHRHLSFSVVSQRYVDVTRLGFHVPPAVADVDEETRRVIHNALSEAADAALKAYGRIVDELTDAGKPRKQAREAARAIVPNAVDSPMVVTGNLRAWKHVIRMRWHVAADTEIRELAGLILGELRKIAPNTMQDVPDMPFGS